jgi:hypothetical protein
MSNGSKKECVEVFRAHYQGATKRQKQAMLDDCCRLCGYHRKYAIRLLNSKARKAKKPSKRGRKKKYDNPLISEVLTDIWVATNLPCAKRLKTIIPLWLPHYDKFIVPDDVKKALLSISAATIDRLMAPHRSKFNKRGLSTTKPGSIIKKRIPVKTNQWDEKIPGFIEADTVAHCANSAAGMFVYTLNCVDIASGWTEQRAVWGKGEQGVKNAIESIEKTLPFQIKGFDCDNGSEFLNWHLIKYLTDRKKPIQLTRARAYHKNDNAHIENKNWTHIRQYLGYQRFENPKLTDKLNDLYTSEWNLYFNYFIPSVKLIAKQRVGSKIIKKYDQPKTPVQRLLESDSLSDEVKKQLSDTLRSLNPFTLQSRMIHKIKTILKEVNKI